MLRRGTSNTARFVSTGRSRIAAFPVMPASSATCAGRRIGTAIRHLRRTGSAANAATGPAASMCGIPGRSHGSSGAARSRTARFGLHPMPPLTGSAASRGPAGDSWISVRARISPITPRTSSGTPPQDFKVTSHVERLAASGCKRAAGNALWCGTCHEPHTNANRTQAACVGCHAGAHHSDETCATCHMPKTMAVDAGHGMFTDHSIPRTRAGSKRQRGRKELVAFLGVADDRAFGMAFRRGRGSPRAGISVARRTCGCGSAAASWPRSRRTRGGAASCTPACCATILRTSAALSISALCMRRRAGPRRQRALAAGARGN